MIDPDDLYDILTGDRMMDDPDMDDNTDYQDYDVDEIDDGFSIYDDMDDELNDLSNTEFFDF